MNNAELFKKVFGIYAEEFWAYAEEKMLDWLTSDVPEMEVGDTISRQAAIDALAEHEKSNGHNYTLFVDIVSECAEIIRDLPSAEPRWIPVAEGLPGYGEDVLLTVGAYCAVGYLSATNDEETDEWYFSGWYHPMSDVTAWMPLPKPWKGEEDE